MTIRAMLLGQLVMLMVGLSLLMGCTQSEETTGSDKSASGIAVPQQISAQMEQLPDGEMTAYASLDGGARQKMTFSEGNFRVSYRFDNLPPGLHALSVVFEFTRANETQAIDIAKGVYTVNLKPGKNNPDFTEDSYEYANSDADSLTNLQELTVGSNPLVEDMAVTVDAAPMSKEVTLSWAENQYAAGFNVYVSADENCDVKNYTACTDGKMFSDENPPFKVPGLNNGTPYYFQLESVYKLGATEATTVEPPVGARPNNLVIGGAAVYGITIDDAGNSYIGGDFTRVGPATGGGLPIDKITGRASYAAFPIVVGEVYASASDGNGGWFIGGAFTHVHTHARNNLAHILSDGSVDLNWNPDANSKVLALALDGDSVYIGGEFTTVGSQGRKHLAAIATNNGSVLNWNPSANDAVLTLVVNGNTVYMGGEFTSIDGQVRNYLAAVNTNGTFRDWNLDANSSVSALVVGGDSVYVGGDFTTIGGKDRDRLAAFNANGSLHDWNPGADSIVRALAVDGETVYVGGDFTTIGGQDQGEKRNRLAAIATNGSLLAWNPGTDSSVRALAVDGGTVYAGGGFVTIGGFARNHLAAIGKDGRVHNWNPDAGNWVEALAVDDNTVYVGGRFTTIGGQPRTNLAAIGHNGTLLPWHPDASRNPWSWVRTLVVDGDTVYVGGEFSTIGGKPRNRLAAIATDGTLLGWNPDAGDKVNALVVDGDRVYVGGDFTTIGGQVRNRLAAIATDGTLFDWNPNANGIVRALAIDGSTVYAGGEFTAIGDPDKEQQRNRLAAIAGDGTLLNWNPNVGARVSVLAVDGNTVYVGGDFSTVDDKERNRLAAITIDGSLLDWNPDANNSVFTLMVDGNSVYVGGDFRTIGGLARKRLAAITTHGSLLNWNPGANNHVRALAVDGNTLYVGGWLTTMGGYVQGGFARFTSDGTLLF